MSFESQKLFGVSYRNSIVLFYKIDECIHMRVLDCFTITKIELEYMQLYALLNRLVLHTHKLSTYKHNLKVIYINTFFVH